MRERSRCHAMILYRADRNNVENMKVLADSGCGLNLGLSMKNDYRYTIRKFRIADGDQR